MTSIVPNAAGGNWSAGGTWVGGIAPTAADDIDYSTLTGTLTMDGTSAAPNLCRSFTATASTGTLGTSSTSYLKVGDGTAGAFKIVAGLTYAPNAASTVEFVSSATGNNITWGGKTFANVIINGTGSWTQQDTGIVSSSSMFTHTKGTYSTNNQSVSALYSSSNSNTRTLTLGSSSWTCPSFSGTVWDITNSSGMTLSAASSTIGMSISGTSPTFSGGGLTYGTLSCTTISTGSVPVTINGANTFGTLTMSNSASVGSTLLLGANQTVTGTFTSNGNSVINRMYIASTVLGTQRTITAATVTVTNIDLQDINGQGAGSWNLAAITGNSGDCGGNSNITFTTPATSYWVPSGATSTGSFSAVTRWANASGGVAGTGRSPLPQDTARFDASSIDAGSRTITQDKPRLGTVDWTGVTNTPAWAKSTICLIFGSITMVSGMTNTGTVLYTYQGRGSSTLTTGTQTLTNPFTIDAVTGTLTQGDNLTMTGATLTVNSGTFAGASAFTINCVAFTFFGGTFSPSATTTLTGALSFTGGTHTQTHTFTGMTTFTISGGATLNPNQNFTMSSGITCQGGTINGTNTFAGTALQFTGAGVTFTGIGTTITGTTCNFNGSGSTYNIGTVTASSTLTTSTGNVYIWGALTAGASVCVYRPGALKYRPNWSGG